MLQRFVLNSFRVCGRTNLGQVRYVTTVADLLLRRVDDSAQVLDTTPLLAAMSLLDQPAARALVVVDDSQTVVGLLTAQGILRSLRKRESLSDATLCRDAVTSVNAVVYASPSDSLLDCAILMTKLRVDHLPVLADERFRGFVSLHDISSAMLEPLLSGKSAAEHALPRSHSGVKGSDCFALNASRVPVFLRTGAAAFPRESPNKRASEDAFFALHVRWPGGASVSAPRSAVSYMGVADGVGTWQACGVDPRVYARSLMRNAANHVLTAARDADAAVAVPPSPNDVLSAAWSAVRHDGVVGSATALLVHLDNLNCECCQ